MDSTSISVIALISLAVIWGLTVWQRSLVEKLHSFLGESKVELKKVTWPGRKEVSSTTVVVIIAVLVFGIFLSVVDGVSNWLRTELFAVIDRWAV